MSTGTDAARPMVDIILTMFNGAAYLPELLRSLQAQTHSAWRLWLRDDGSNDATVALVREAAAADARLTLLHDAHLRRGAVAGFGWLLERVPANAAYVMCADQDDVWLPTKIECTLAAMRRAEAEGPGPVLVHTDMTVVDAALHPIAPSFWRYAGMDPEPITLRRLVVQNVATGATTMLNRALRELVTPIPPEAVFQDWWFACAAAAFGRIVALRESTMLYRQHGGNAVGAKEVTVPSWSTLPGAARDAMARTALLRREIDRTARQAGAFLARYGGRLGEGDRRFLAAYARLPARAGLRRKLEIARLRLRPEHGLWRNLGVLLRA